MTLAAPRAPSFIYRSIFTLLRALYNPCIRETDSWTNYAVVAGPGFIKTYAIILGVNLPTGNIYEVWEHRVEYDGIEAGFCKVVLTGATSNGSTWVAAFNAVNGSILFNATTSTPRLTGWTL